MQFKCKNVCSQLSVCLWKRKNNNIKMTCTIYINRVHKQKLKNYESYSKTLKQLYHTILKNKYKNNNSFQFHLTLRRERLSIKQYLLQYLQPMLPRFFSPQVQRWLFNTTLLLSITILSGIAGRQVKLSWCLQKETVAAWF